jgi:outer membrane lipoprotein
VIAALAVGSCASTVPPAIRGEIPGAPTVRQVQQAQEAHLGRRVRWGGSILAVRNLADRTEIEVLARALAGDGEPRVGAEGEGRFIARLSGFVDPAEYPADRLLTVVGRVLEVVIRDVGEYPYRYPVVSADSRYLWPEPDPLPGSYPFGYPWGSPWDSTWGSPWSYGYGGFGSWYGPSYGPFYRPWYGPW